jgi:hypothetical protein
LKPPDPSGAAARIYQFVLGRTRRSTAVSLFGVAGLLVSTCTGLLTVEAQLSITFCRVEALAECPLDSFVRSTIWMSCTSPVDSVSLDLSGTSTFLFFRSCTRGKSVTGRPALAHESGRTGPRQFSFCCNSLGPSVNGPSSSLSQIRNTAQDLTWALGSLRQMTTSSSPIADLGTITSFPVRKRESDRQKRPGCKGNWINDDQKEHIRPPIPPAHRINSSVKPLRRVY